MAVEVPMYRLPAGHGATADSSRGACGVNAPQLTSPALPRSPGRWVSLCPGHMAEGRVTTCVPWSQ